MKIIFRGNEYTNSSSRDGHIPIGICDHISDGTMRSMRAWFTDPFNKVSSSHYGISKTGEIDEYVDIRRMAWTQGITPDKLKHVTADIVHDYCKRQGRFVNPNKFLVGIEHEGTDGKLTDAQLEASIKLHIHIRNEIARIWGKNAWFPLNSYTVTGHFQIDPIRKPMCPGPNFPWEELYLALWEADNMAKDNEQDRRIASLEAKVGSLEKKVQQMEANSSDIEVPGWAEEALEYYSDNIDTKTGTMAFWRILTIMHRKEKGISIMTIDPETEDRKGNDGDK